MQAGKDGNRCLGFHCHDEPWHKHCFGSLRALFEEYQQDTSFISERQNADSIYRNERTAKAVLIGAIPPVMIKSEKNPGGTPVEVFDQLRAAVQADRSQFWKDL